MCAALVRFAELSWRLALATLLLCCCPCPRPRPGGAAAVGSGRSAHCGAVARRRRQMCGRAEAMSCTRIPSSTRRWRAVTPFSAKRGEPFNLGVRRGRRDARGVWSVFRSPRNPTGEWLASHLAGPWHHRHRQQLRALPTARSHGIRTDDSIVAGGQVRRCAHRLQGSVRAGRTPTWNHGPRRLTPLMPCAPCATSLQLCLRAGWLSVSRRAGRRYGPPTS